MKALLYEGPREMRIREIAPPSITEDEVVIQVAFSGICGSELSGYLGHNALRKPPLVFGHEFSGTIVEAGANASKVFGLQPGQRVTANPLVTCGHCGYCLSGRQQLCRGRKLLSAALPGSNAELVKIPAAFVHPLPDHLTLQQGALVEPIACGVRVAELASPRPGDKAVIFGMGPIGLFVLQALKVYGVKEIYAVDLHAERLGMAEALGAVPLSPRKDEVVAEVLKRTGGGADIAVDAVGASLTRSQCMEVTVPGGRIIYTGLHEAESVLPVNTMIRSEFHVAGSFAYSAVNFQTALNWLAEGRIGLTDGVVEAPLEEGAEWYDKLLSNPGKVAKVLLVPYSSSVRS
ncbi:alcohol dehydrogenase catalytic domain-containing protein [Paenibacillus aurantius]|uniref:Alcohol dehydrogenase catalytic domain-containing protein n=1 Tax=Paenibacillus aurantius TaxID=2918900 RepID=A0AA96LEJ7_9BACL|nr:alcohol dehydrogenase catalytic domain-containing protein [Paenibacillus aurantius]WNQ12352.1 alcohol dehydrogenase catalytic domain-containing protein [Paenibacillus aurantius]